MVSQAMQDYLKVIYKLLEVGEQATTSAIANWLGIAPASVTNMLKRLARLHLVQHEPYYGVTLTPYGRSLALEVVRYHRLAELFLCEVLGMSWDRVHQEAHRLEHALSEDVAERMERVLGHPTTDPHGHPIPRSDGNVAPLKGQRLSEVASGTSGVVTAVGDESPELLRYLGERGLYPGTRLDVVYRDPFGGPIRLGLPDRESMVGLEAAMHVWMSVA